MEKKNNKHKKEEKEIKKEHCSNEECNCKETKEECTCNEECSCGDNKLEDKIKNLEEALLRSQAELINYKRRKDEETNRIIKYAEEDILKGFLPILDNFERAISMDDDNLEDEVSKFLEGFKLMYKQIKDLLEKFEVKEIDCLIVSILLAVLAVKFVIWLLPVILIALVSYLLYMNIKKNKKEENINKEKNIKVIHDFDDDK